MKIQIGNNLRQNNEYDLTIDPSGLSSEPKSPWNIECENNEATEIKVQIDIIPAGQIVSYFSLLRSKIRLGGTIIIYGKNLNEINRLFYAGEINDFEFNNLIYENEGVYTPSTIKEFLQDYLITNIKLDNITYYLEAKREN